MGRPTAQWRSRRWFQFRLRTVLAAVAVLCALLAWLSLEMYRANRRREAVAKLRGMRARVEYDYQIHFSSDYGPVPHGPAWLRSLLGDDFFNDVEKVTLPGYLPLTPIDDDDVALLPCLDSIRELGFNPCQITDAGMVQIGQLRHLEALRINGCRISDEGARSLASLTNLQTLDLYDTDVTGKGLRYVAGLRELERLSLSGLKIDDDGLRHLNALRKLGELNLDNTKITPRGMQHLAGLSGLWLLSLSGTQVSNDGLRVIGKLKDLRVLDLSDCPIDDEGLAHLAGLKQLRLLHVARTAVTWKGLEPLLQLPEFDCFEFCIEGCHLTREQIDILRALHKKRDPLAPF